MEYGEDDTNDYHAQPAQQVRMANSPPDIKTSGSISSRPSKKMNSVLITPMEAGSKKSAIPTELHIKVKTLSFNRPSDFMKQGLNEGEKHEA